MVTIRQFVLKFIGYNILRGRKSFSFRIFYNLLFFLKIRFNLMPVSILLTAYENLSPVVISRTRKNRWGSYLKEIPRFIFEHKKFVIFLLWSMKDLKLRAKGKPFFYLLNKSISNAYLNTGLGVSKKREFYKKFKPEEREEEIQFKA